MLEYIHMTFTASRKQKIAYGIGVLLTIFAAYTGYIMLHFHIRSTAAYRLVDETTKYDRMEGEEGRYLVLGDSLAYGVGTTTPESSFAGVLGARYPDHAIINEAVVGYDSQDLAENIDQHINGYYDGIFIIVGGNDIVRYETDLQDSANYLQHIYSTAAAHSDRVYAMTTGDFDAVTMIPHGLKGYFSNRSKEVRSIANNLEAEIPNLSYIDVFALEEFDYNSLEADDGFHLNDEGIDALVDLVVQDIE